VAVLAWEGCFNVRDLGGLPTVDGRTTRCGALVRADSLCRLTEAGCRAARDHGLSLVIDLRSQREIDERHVIRRLAAGSALAPAGEHPFCPAGAHPDGIAYRRMRLWTSDEAFWARVRAATSQMHIYKIILDEGAPGFAALAREVIAAPPGAVVVHCQVGKDRTGLAVALLLSAVGVTDDAIAADYALSARYLQPYLDYRRTLGVAPESEPANGMTSPPETMLALLAEMRESSGGAVGYLRAGGLTEEDLGTLRRRLIG
jgi:protein tyrosine/serine phosphatase